VLFSAHHSRLAHFRVTASERSVVMVSMKVHSCWPLIFGWKHQLHRRDIQWHV